MPSGPGGGGSGAGPARAVVRGRGPLRGRGLPADGLPAHRRQRRRAGCAGGGRSRWPGAGVGDRAAGVGGLASAGRQPVEDWQRYGDGWQVRVVRANGGGPR
jgi:hypothetical protein